MSDRMIEYDAIRKGQALDYLRRRLLLRWAPESAKALAVRRVAGAFRTDPTDRTDQSDRKSLKEKNRWVLYTRRIARGESTSGS
jgi:hypothetical protein